MIIKVFLETAGNFAERELLQRFYNGIQRSLATGNRLMPDTDENDEVLIDIDRGHSPCDVAIIMGSWKPREKDHHLVRTSVVENSPCFIVVETPLLGRKTSQPNTHFRVGVNGFLYKSGKFFTEQQVNGARLSNLNISWNGWKNDPNGHIVLLMQLPGDASLRGINFFSWAKYAIEEIRKKTNKKIIVRTHPLYNPKDGDEYYKFVADIFTSGLTNIEFSKGKEKTLDQELKGAYCTVAYSSGSSIDSIIAGIPAIACDPGNFAYDISTNFIGEINHLKLKESKDIVRWLETLAYSQWTVEEMENGVVWNHLLPTLTEKLKTIPRKGKK